MALGQCSSANAPHNVQHRRGAGLRGMKLLIVMTLLLLMHSASAVIYPKQAVKSAGHKANNGQGKKKGPSRFKTFTTFLKRLFCCWRPPLDDEDLSRSGRSSTSVMAGDTHRRPNADPVDSGGGDGQRTLSGEEPTVHSSGEGGMTWPGADNQGPVGGSWTSGDKGDSTMRRRSASAGEHSINGDPCPPTQPDLEQKSMPSERPGGVATLQSARTQPDCTNWARRKPCVCTSCSGRRNQHGNIRAKRKMKSRKAQAGLQGGGAL